MLRSPADRSGGEPIWQAGGTYPLEGGYFYLNPANSPTYVYSLGFTGAGAPSFTLAAQTAEQAPANAGVGPPVITSYQGQAGTAILWVYDPSNRLRAYYAVPQNGKMVRITLPASPAVNKFQRLVLGMVDITLHAITVVFMYVYSLVLSNRH